MQDDEGDRQVVLQKKKNELRGAGWSVCKPRRRRRALRYAREDHQDDEEDGQVVLRKGENTQHLGAV